MNCYEDIIYKNNYTTPNTYILPSVIYSKSYSKLNTSNMILYLINRYNYNKVNDKKLIKEVENTVENFIKNSLLFNYNEQQIFEYLLFLNTTEDSFTQHMEMLKTYSKKLVLIKEFLKIIERYLLFFQYSFTQQDKNKNVENLYAYGFNNFRYLNIRDQCNNYDMCSFYIFKYYNNEKYSYNSFAEMLFKFNYILDEKNYILENIKVEIKNMIYFKLFAFLTDTKLTFSNKNIMHSNTYKNKITKLLQGYNNFYNYKIFNYNTNPDKDYYKNNVDEYLKDFNTEILYYNPDINFKIDYLKILKEQIYLLMSTFKSINSL